MKKHNNELRLDLNEGQKPLITKSLGANLLTSNDVFQYAREQDLADLKKTTAKRLGVSPANLVFTNGTYHALDLIFSFLVKDGEEIIMPVPTFAFYHKFEKHRHFVWHKIKYHDHLKLPVTKILSHLNDKTRLIYIVNPNNPLGSVATTNELEIVIKAARTKGALVLIDEAYGEYIDSSVASLVNKYKNLIVLRSFSKIGLSGLKLGVIVSNETKINKIEEIRGDIYNVNKTSIILVDNFLSQPEQINNYVREITETRKKLIDFLAIRKVVVLPSQANFVTAKFFNVDEFCQKILEQGVWIKNLSHYPDSVRWLKSYARITVPAKKDLPRLLRSLEKVMDEMSKN
ncbi:MAG: Histidinol-phosphate aminotransferase [Candidatus Woesebacteria bacterium GW2011_GWA1_39_21b]|uniref:Aminotransferase class I/classII large domain-containing protein n=2 Tax=Patescibacteria group TaxID=1783273 RepID=A0A1G2QH73_9BACT|nr:MAG: Histidinol-phosphate aminotransferase [Candidatus Woesebacteria bacterium GW2011_GWA1_39_21b]KKS77187.1 MAG: Histidinol-phosphate aminotransferase [Parcubacteria group bacterium GW2011_GWB1_42_9]KKS89761.1 MAG: Histidinol-phosphate aminotransferase [Parcubacteria group bacterium GW2011_GWC1_43_11b]OHA59331.1 MAG: hypothetical protein A2370_00070 [Candidatus Vogelbacteria bacterium RIFOXYB1_FULL_42_16]